MNLRKILPGFIALLTLTVVISSCLNDDNLIPANCFDGILNNGEFDVDCGGANCDPCPPSCTNGLWDPDFGEIDIDCGGPNCDACPTCNDGIINQDELGIDCGGENCDPCSTTGSCINGVLDPSETGVDCGGPDCYPCPVPSCDDGEMNGLETGIDCGGPDCPACPEPTCEDGIMNGLETGIDCGDGLFCPPCQMASQGQIIFRANNSNFEAYGGATATVEGDLVFTITLSGSGGADEQITFLIPNAQTLADGNTVNFNQTTAGAGYVIGLEYGIYGNFLTDTPNSDVAVNFTSIGVTPGTIISGTFEGQMYNFTESFNFNLTEGSFNLVLQ